FLCTGISSGDFGSWFLGLFGGRSGGEVAVINGRGVTHVDIVNLRNQRQVANIFMTNAVIRSWENRKASLIRKMDEKRQMELDRQWQTFAFEGNMPRMVVDKGYVRKLTALELTYPKFAKEISNFRKAVAELGEIYLELRGSPQFGLPGTPFFDGGDTDD